MKNTLAIRLATACMLIAGYTIAQTPPASGAAASPTALSLLSAMIHSVMAAAARGFAGGL